jgi:mismatch-specific thymine-DNA glycosylase
LALRIHYDGHLTLADILADDLAVLFVGYNPSVLAVERAHYYPRTGNRFWEDLHEAGFVPRVLRQPGDDLLLPSFGLGLTDVIKRPSPTSDGLTAAEYAAGFARLAELVARHRPRIVCFNGLGLYQRFRQRGGGFPGVEVVAVPSTSPRNNGLRAQRLEAFRRLKALVDALPPRGM